MKKPTLFWILHAAIILALLVGAHFIVETHEEALSGAGGNAPAVSGH